MPAETQTTYLTTDTLGSPRVITDENGEVVSRRDFLPFGEEILTNDNNRKSALGYSSSDSLRQKFTGYEKDTETDLEFAQNRYYSNKLGRFTTPDPLMASADILDPQTFNRFAYVNNNPLNLIDPNGLMGCDPKDEPCPEDEIVDDPVEDTSGQSSTAFPNLIIREDKTASVTGEDGRTINFTLVEVSEDDFNGIIDNFSNNRDFTNRQTKLIATFLKLRGKNNEGDDDTLDHPEGPRMKSKGGFWAQLGKGIGGFIRNRLGKAKKAKPIQRNKPKTTTIIPSKLDNIDDVIDSATNWSRVKAGRQGWITGTDADTVFRNIARREGITLKAGQRGFKTSNGDYVGNHTATRKKGGKTRGQTLDINQGGQVYKIGFIP